MSLSKKIAVTAGSLMLLGSFSASAISTIFEQDFDAGLNTGAYATTETIAIDPGESASGIDTRYVNCGGSCPFSVNNHPTDGTTRNFNVHHKDTNPYAGGTSGSMVNHNMMNQVLGHVYADYNGHEDNYYQIDGLDLTGFTDLSLMFEFDSWIESDSPDGFAVAISDDDGASWDLLTPNGASEMQYRQIGTVGDNSLNVMTGQSGATGAAIVGFDGHENGGNMEGTAMFDISDSFAGDSVSLRFAFASDGDSNQAEGINIDKIKLRGCIPPDPDCDTPGGGNNVPAPATLVLAALGVMAVRRRRAKH